MSSTTAPAHAPAPDHRAAIRARLRRFDYAPPAPGSVSWKVNREVVVIAGWGRAILLQLAHPAIAAGIRDHSGFRGSLINGIRRLRSTVRAMQALSFGDTEAMIEAAAGINAIHDRISGQVGETGSARYSAHDPVLQRWVHATLLDSILRAYEQLVGPLTADERDRYCQEAAIMEPLLGMPHGWLPRDTAALDRCMRETLESGAIVVTAVGRALGRAVLFPPRWRAAWPLFKGMQLLTIGSLPAPIREAYGFAWSARDARAAARTAATLRMLVRRLPAFAREWPMARRRTRTREEDGCREIALRPFSR